MQKPSLRLSILGTLAYSSVFEHPLSLQELQERLIGMSHYSELELSKELSHIPQIKKNSRWLLLSNHEDQITTRQKRQYFSKIKKAEAKTIVTLLESIPTITSAYITGSLAMENVVSPADDIDLLIITKPGTLWMTRLMIVLWTSALGKYRLHGTRGDWGWCFNLWLDQQHLEMPKEHRSVYSAYEVIQAKQILGTQNELLGANEWINEYINYSSSRPKLDYFKTQIKGDTVRNGFLEKMILLFAKVLEKPSYLLQRIYMQPKKTKERVGTGFAFFHPRETKQLIVKKWKERLKDIGLKEKEIEQLVNFFERGGNSSS